MMSRDQRKLVFLWESEIARRLSALISTRPPWWRFRARRRWSAERREILRERDAVARELLHADWDPLLVIEQRLQALDARHSCDLPVAHAIKRISVDDEPPCWHCGRTNGCGYSGRGLP
jgi:hypothetical protein